MHIRRRREGAGRRGSRPAATWRECRTPPPRWPRYGSRRLAFARLRRTARSYRGHPPGPGSRPRRASSLRRSVVIVDKQIRVAHRALRHVAWARFALVERGRLRGLALDLARFPVRPVELPAAAVAFEVVFAIAPRFEVFLSSA